MKIISSTVLVALFAASNARFLDSTNPALTVSSTYGSTAYASSLNCGQCVGLGYNYCVQKAEDTILNADAASSVQTCINPATTTTASQYTDNTYSCTNAFTDRVYSKYVCQFNTASCGLTNNTVVLSAVNATSTVVIANLTSGNTCFYKVLTSCGAPGFKPVGNNSASFEYEYTYFKDTDLTATDAVVTGAGAQSNTTRSKAAPAAGMPRRDHFFQSQVGANMIANGNLTTYNSTINGNVFGVSGRYDKVAGGRKVWGTQTQGDAQLGQFTQNSTSDCANRWQYVAVTNTAATAQSVNVTFSSVAFYHTPSAVTTSGASFLSMTFAVVLGLISLAFF